MSSSPRANVLSERDPNIPQSPEKNKSNLKGDCKQQDAPKSLDYHRQVLEQRLKESKSVNTTNETPMSQPSAAEDSTVDAASFGSNATAITTQYGHGQNVRQAHTVRSLSRNQQTYISPSDSIMSPATAKLAAFKSRHVKSVKPRTLFAKTTANNAEVAAAKQSSTSSPSEQEKAAQS